MDKRCTICTHPALTEIDRALQAGASLPSLAAPYGLSVSALSHRTKHLRRTLAAAADEAHLDRQTALLDKSDLFEYRQERIFHQAQENHALPISLGCVQEALRIFTLREKIR